MVLIFEIVKVQADVISFFTWESSAEGRLSGAGGVGVGRGWETNQEYVDNLFYWTVKHLNKK